MSFGNCQTNLTTRTWSEGEHSVIIYANDTSGNIGEAGITFKVDSVTPSIGCLSPGNDSGDQDGNLTFVYNVIDSGSVSSCSLILNEEINQTNNSIVERSAINFSVINLPVGFYNWSINCSDSSGNIGTNSSFGVSVIASSDFSGKTTNLTTINISNITNLIIDEPNYGSINFTELTDLSNNTDLNSYVNISFNSIELNSSALPHLNKSSELTLYNLTLSNPQLLKDGSVCSSEICSKVSYSSGTLVFTVIQFSTYSTQETPAGGSSSAGDGSSGGGTTSSSKGTIEYECTFNTQCGQDLYCWNNLCVKIFDIKVLDFASPVDVNTPLNFTYLLKGMASIEGDVVVDFWLERDSKNVSSGSDTIYLGAFEEKIESTKIFIPPNLETGTYEFHISVNYERYSASAHRTIYVTKSEDGTIVIENIRSSTVEKFFKSGQFLFSLIFVLILLTSLVIYFRYESLKIRWVEFKKNNRHSYLDMSKPLSSGAQIETSKDEEEKPKKKKIRNSHKKKVKKILVSEENQIQEDDFKDPQEMPERKLIKGLLKAVLSKKMIQNEILEEEDLFVQK